MFLMWVFDGFLNQEANAYFHNKSIAPLGKHLQAATQHHFARLPDGCVGQ
jgi:hypothetical protein